MQSPSAEALLQIWERGRHCHPLDRALLLYALTMPDEDLDRLADRPLGDRNRALLLLRQAMFGDRLGTWLDCPGCAERLEFALSVNTLVADARRAEKIELEGVRFRLPTTRDLAAIAGHTETESAIQNLMVLLAESPCALDASQSATLVPRLEAALEAADPLSDLALNLDCPACGHGWTAAFDVPSYVWSELSGRAQHLLDQVHLLARAYGWSEQEILRLPEARRAAYLERVQA